MTLYNKHAIAVEFYIITDTDIQKSSELAYLPLSVISHQSIHLQVNFNAFFPDIASASSSRTTWTWALDY